MYSGEQLLAWADCLNAKLRRAVHLPGDDDDDATVSSDSSDDTQRPVRTADAVQASLVEIESRVTRLADEYDRRGDTLVTVVAIVHADLDRHPGEWGRGQPSLPTYLYCPPRIHRHHRHHRVLCHHCSLRHQQKPWGPRISEGWRSHNLHSTKDTECRA